MELQGTWAGTSSGSLLVTTTDTVPAVIDDLYIVTVASKSYEVVAGVAGLGLDWVLVGAQCGGRDQTGTTVFAGHGTPTVAMPITAVFMDEPNNAAIAVQRYSGTSTFDPVGATVSGNTNGVFGRCSGGDDDNVYSFDLATSDGAVAFSAAAMRYREHSVTVPWTELLEFHHGSSAGDQVGLAISVHALDPLDPAAGVSITGLLSGNVDYAVVAFEIRPTGDEPPPGDDPPADDPLPDDPPPDDPPADDPPPDDPPPDDPPADDPPPDDPPGDDPPPEPATLVIHEGTWTGSSAGVVDVDTDGPVPAVDGDLQLVSVASKPYRKVTSVVGLGLEWTLVDEQCGGRHQTAVTVFMARGATGGDDQVTASMESDPKNAVIAVSRYSGVSANDPIGTVVSVNTNGVDASCNSGDDDDEYAVDLVPSGATGMVFSAVAMRMRDHDPDTGWTEHVEVNRGSRSGDRAGLAVSERPIAGAADVTVNGRFNRSVDYAVIGLELRSVADDLDLPPALGVQREGVWTGSARRDEVVQTTSRVQAVDGDLYLVAIASKPYEPVDAVEGLGLSWFRAVEQCGGRHQTGVTVFVAMGTTSGDSVITARMDDDPKNALITVLRYSGIDPDDPIAFVASANTNGISGGCDGGSDGSGYAYEMAPASASGVLVTAAAMRMRGHTLGPGWTEVAETHRGRRTGEELLAPSGGAVHDEPSDGPGDAPADRGFHHTSTGHPHPIPGQSGDDARDDACDDDDEVGLAGQASSDRRRTGGVPWGLALPSEQEYEEHDHPHDEYFGQADHVGPRSVLARQRDTGNACAPGAAMPSRHANTEITRSLIGSSEDSRRGRWTSRLCHADTPALASARHPVARVRLGELHLAYTSVQGEGLKTGPNRQGSKQWAQTQVRSTTESRCGRSASTQRCVGARQPSTRP